MPPLDRFFRPGSASDIVARANRAAGRPAPKPKPKPPTRPNPAPIARAVRRVGTTTTRAARTTTRTVAPSRVARVQARTGKVRSIDDLLAKYSAPPAPRRNDPSPYRVGGFDLEAINRAAAQGRGPIGYVLGNAARELTNMFTSIPAQTQLVADALLYPIARATGSEQIADTTGRQLRAAGAGLRDYYVNEAAYGPLLRGEFGEAGRRLARNPISHILDVAAGYGAIGRAPSAAARVTRAVSREGSRVDMAATRSLSGLSGPERARVAQSLGRAADVTAEGVARAGARYRPPRVTRTKPSTPETGRPVTAQAETIVPRAPYSGNVITRGVQKGVDRARSRVASRIELRMETRGSRVAPSQKRPTRERSVDVLDRVIGLSGDQKFRRATRRETLLRRDTWEARQELAFTQAANRAAKAFRKLRPDRDPVRGIAKPGLGTEQAATRLHLDDVLGEPGKGRGGLTPSQLRDRWVRRVEGEQRAARARGIRTNVAREQVEVVKAVPEDLLNLTDTSNPAVRRVLRAVEEGRKLDEISQGRSVQAGVVTRETAEAVRSRGSALTVGGSRWAQDAIQKIVARNKPKKAALIRKIEEARARGDLAIARKARRDLATLRRNEKGRIGYIRRQSTRDTPELREARGKLAEAEVRRAKATDPVGRDAATRSRDRYFKQVRKLEREALGFTPPRRPDLVGDRGVYIPDRPADVRAGRPGGPRQAGRLSGADVARQSKGRLRSSARMDMNPDLLIAQAERAAKNYTGTISPQALKELTDMAAFRDPKGAYITGKRAELLAKTEPDKVAMVNLANLRRAIKASDELPHNQFLPDELVREVFPTEIKQGTRASDYIAISKDAADVWTEAMKRVPVLDRALDLWKGGLLTLSPRWYVNNTVGLSFQYGVMAPGDIASIVRANAIGKRLPFVRKAQKGLVREAITKRSPATVKDTMAADIYSGNLPRAMEVGFRINSRIEEFWRRAAYYNRVKRTLRDEGGRFRKMTEADIARAIENMPDEAARAIVRDVDFFIGNFRRFNAFERQILRRVFPFYSWLRVIGRLTFGLPFRSPTRVAAMNVLGKAATAGINPEDQILPYYARGALDIAGKKIPTWTLNPFQTLVPVVVAVGAKNPVGELAEESIAWVHPAVQFLVAYATGSNNFGQGVTTPPGTALFGRGEPYLNPATGERTYEKPRVPLEEAILNTLFPGQVSVARRIASTGKTPYDTTKTRKMVLDALERAAGGKGDPSLYRPVDPKKGRRPGKYSFITSIAGAPYYTHDLRQMARDWQRFVRGWEGDMETLENQRRKLERGG